MTLSLLSLPVELILVIFDFLCPAVSQLPKTCEECRTSFLPSAEETKFAPYSTLQLHSLSLVCHQSRRLCHPWLFSCLKITHTDQLRSLEAKCLADIEFASVIKFVAIHIFQWFPIDDFSFRQLNLARVDSPERRTDDVKKRIHRYGPDILPGLLRCLQSLEWLYLSVAQIDGSLLSSLNSHPALTTVAVCDNNLQALRALFVSTTLSMSKIRVHSVLSDFSLTLRSSVLRSVMRRSPRLVHLSLRDSSNIKDGPGSMFLPGLERLGIRMYPEPTHSMAWLPSFAARHTSLRVIDFSGVGSNWRQNPDIAFPPQLYDAVERTVLARTISLNAFSISRPPSASSLDEWPVTELEMTIAKSASVSGLRIASLAAPNTSVLIVRMSRSVQHAVHILELHHLYRHLLYEGQAPWILPPPVGKTSRCTSAHSALLWIAAQVASLELLHITDEGSDLEVSEHEKRFNHPWTLKAMYRIQRNGDVEYHGTAHMDVAKRYRQATVMANRPIIYGRELRPVI
ncbi:hypothetical protein C8F04DRAFT_1342362 [Mycena alexandri]|uniref:F-box domain-containing protein n=1 Tax=Mycena alexandri TaxID=1745969 RepID=A0AAD6SX97_9AGAR|nr:hypothetical protein C8F04DRAFT_1342362 [Mycena alexandri]